MSKTATAIAHPNIAFIKYWGNRDDMMRLPSNGSIAMIPSKSTEKEPILQPCSGSKTGWLT